MNCKIKKLWVVWYCVLLHIAWGIILIVTKEKLSTTTIDTFFHLNNNPFLIGIGLVCVGLMAGYGLFNHKWPKFIDCFFVLPQQFILVLSALGAISAIVNSQFADGVIRSRAFIFCDQLPAILVAIFHTIVVISFFGGDFFREIFKKSYK